MNKSRKPEERRELSSGEFTKIFIKNFVLNSILVGIVIGVIYELVKGFLPNIVTTILSFVLVPVVIVKVYLSAIRDSFYVGKIHKEDINRISKNITLMFVILLLINIGIDYMLYASSLEFCKVLGLEYVDFRNLIINIVANIIMYTIITVSCRVKFLKECENQENII